ncbi:DUF7146 domain-containing protein [Inhella gelatinilytica]|uniref:Toprim domain-containing protein n=1 Tax=Inhella gelatinilytica TaxID=2795030 RepID=A0A931IZB0_9BURK|nr:toprim domain-containing protein [Inhella gelatinilytica]MBH9553333.1 toprim domain-containing protein [Inhella gelatinilytica]
MTDTRAKFLDFMRHVLSGAPDFIEPGKLQRFSTNGRRGDTAGWCKLFEDGRGGVFGCHRQGIFEVWSAVDRRAMSAAELAQFQRQVQASRAEREREQRQRWAQNAERVHALWAECEPLLPGDSATLYLKRRGLGGMWPLPDCLRFHPRLGYWADGQQIGLFPAMVSAITSPEGELVALHRTYLTQGGRKAPVPTVKKLTAAAGPLAGACIALAKPSRGVLGISEGIETGLAAGLASGLPVVAAYSASNLAQWIWPSDVRRIVVFADNDKAGLDAADTLRARALRADLRCEVHSPSDAGVDWCDVWAAGQSVGVQA